MLRTPLVSPSINAFAHSISFPFHTQQSPSTSPILGHPFPLPLLSPFLCTPPSRGMLSPTLGQSYFSTRLPRNVGLNIIMPKQHPAPLKSCLRKGTADPLQIRPLPLLSVDPIPSTIPDDLSMLGSVDLSDFFLPERSCFKPVKGRPGTPRPEAEDIEWLNLQDEVELLREQYMEEVEATASSSASALSSMPTTPQLNSQSRPSVHAFRKFCSLSFVRVDPSGSRKSLDPFNNKQSLKMMEIVQETEQTVIYSTGPPPCGPKKLSFEASAFYPRVIHGESGGQWICPRLTPYPSPRSNFLDLDEAFISDY